MKVWVLWQNWLKDVREKQRASNDEREKREDCWWVFQIDVTLVDTSGWGDCFGDS